jgi:Cadherin domain.
MIKIEILHIISNLIFSALSANNLHNILQAADPDEGLNADIRYQILGRMDDESRKFIIDPVTGQVRSIVSFAYDAGRVYGFDVKATDKRGADDGKSAITNVFVSVFWFILYCSFTWHSKIIEFIVVTNENCQEYEKFMYIFRVINSNAVYRLLLPKTNLFKFQLPPVA